jgi:uncharacterized peroxidase-related enzyme
MGNRRNKRSTRIDPLPPGHTPELKNDFEALRRAFGFVPNGYLIMQRKPKVVKALAQMINAVWNAESTIDRGFSRLVVLIASGSAGCQYCMAHTAVVARHFGTSNEKLAAIHEYRTSPLYSEAERAALDFAAAAASVPNAVTDEMFTRMRGHWTDDQIIEILAMISLMGFFNRWNDTLGTPLEPEAIAVGQEYLAPGGWSIGKHAP